MVVVVVVDCVNGSVSGTGNDVVVVVVVSVQMMVLVEVTYD